MLKKLLTFVLVSFGKCVQVMKGFVLDSAGPIQITYFHFLLFGIFVTIVIRLINYIKQVQEIENENNGKYKVMKEIKMKRNVRK